MISELLIHSSLITPHSSLVRIFKQNRFYARLAGFLSFGRGRKALCANSWFIWA